MIAQGRGQGVKGINRLAITFAKLKIDMKMQ